MNHGKITKIQMNIMPVFFDIIPKKDDLAKFPK